MKPVSGRIVFRTYQEMRAMFSGPDCPCNPVFRIEKENGKLFEGTSISITNNNLVLETSQPTSIDLNLKAYF